MRREGWSRSSFQVEDVDGAVAATDAGQPVANRRARCGGRTARRLGERQTAREQRGKGGGVRATGAVRGGDVVALDGDLEVTRAVEEVIDGIAVPTGDDHRGRPQLHERLCELRL